MRAYTSTLYTSPVSHKTHSLCFVLAFESVVVYFSTATNRRSRGALWSIIAPPFIQIRLRIGMPDFAAFFHQRVFEKFSHWGESVEHNADGCDID